MEYYDLVIDGPYLAHKSLNAPFKLTTKNGINSTTIHAFFRSFFYLYNKFAPCEIFVTWESPGTKSWRRSQLPTYKPSIIDEEFISQLNDIQHILSHINVKQYYAPKNEADDVIASILADRNVASIVFTSDKDIHQLVDETHHIFNKRIIKIEDVYERYGVYPYQIPDLLALVGDKPDNIKGVYGIGPKKAAKILGYYKTIEKIPTSVLTPQQKSEALFNKKLTLLNKECEYKPIEIDISESSLPSLLLKYESKAVSDSIEKFLSRNSQGSLF